MKYVYAPGCALMIYKPELTQMVHETLNRVLGDMELLDICCQNHPEIPVGTTVINTCPGCDRRYRQNYEKSSTTSLWEVLSESDFQFPDYGGEKMSILDACPTRDQSRVHDAVRDLLVKMNIRVIEPEKTREKGTCCGDSCYGRLQVEDVKDAMSRRASEMPVNNVVGYCVSCSKSMHIGGKKARYLVDLLFCEETDPKTFEPEEWHRQLEDYQKSH
jgi:hypothetical protein